MDEKEDALQKLSTELKLRGNSPRTVHIYSYFFRKFLSTIDKPLTALEESDIKKFLSTLVDTHANSSRALATSALRFFFRHVMKKPIMQDIGTPKKEEYLPSVLTKEEVKALFNAAATKKSQLMLKLLYSSGLRLSELLALQKKDIDFEHTRGLVKKGKGGKERVFFIAPTLAKELKEFAQTQDIANPFLFQGKNNNALTPRNIQKIIKLAAKKAGIQKNVSPHTMRHSFATHHLQSGTDIRKIQVLLGHARIDTTQIYTKVSTKDLENLKNPLEDINV